METSAATELTEAQAQFAIPANRERRTRTLKHGDTFAMFDDNGDVTSAPGSPEGIFHCDTRHLSQLTLSICGQRPILLSSTLRDDNGALICDLTNPDLHQANRVALEHDLIHVRRLKFLWKSASFERLAVRNFSDRRERVTIRIDFAADFADLFEVRGSQRERRGTYHPAQVETDFVIMSYTGLDGQRRETQLRFAPQPTRLDPTCAIFEVDLDPTERASIFVEIRCESMSPNASPWKLFFSALRDARRDLRGSAARAAAVETSNDIFNEVIRRSVADLYMLTTNLPEGPYPYAGIPWFSTVFGRDALITAMQTLWFDPAIARGVLFYLATNQATKADPAADAEPGKILHEVRRGEMAELGEVPFRRYYGSIDSTPLFVMLAGAYLRRTNDVAAVRALWPHIDAALSWIDVYGDCDGDGFVEYGRKTEEGLINQGWKDSHDSVFHEDGALAQGPIALIEVQGYVYAARCAAAEIARRLGFDDRAKDLERKADDLRTLVNTRFWDEDLGTYVLALDRDKRTCRVRTSNAGHALFTGIAPPERAARVARALTDSALFSGWGIRTVAAGEARYNPMSYHNGSVWPHDNALIALGFASYGFGEEVAKIFKGLFEASIYIDLRRLPELFCGFARVRRQGPTFYPVACSPQAWAATAPLALLAASLGLSFDPQGRRVIFNRPHLPEFLEEVTLRGLTIGDARMDVQLRRTGTDVAVNVLKRTGEIWAATIS
jgi:glycogen debranching enzyme